MLPMFFLKGPASGFKKKKERKFRICSYSNNVVKVDI